MDECCGLDLPMVVSCQHGNKLSDSIKGRVLHVQITYLVFYVLVQKKHTLM